MGVRTHALLVLKLLSLDKLIAGKLEIGWPNTGTF